MLSLLKSLQEQGVITQGDYYFAQLIADKQKDKGYTEPVQNLAILLAALCNWSYTPVSYTHLVVHQIVFLLAIIKNPNLPLGRKFY